jgi:hypothetical protein
VGSENRCFPLESEVVFTLCLALPRLHVMIKDSKAANTCDLFSRQYSFQHSVSALQTAVFKIQNDSVILGEIIEKRS